MIHSESIAKLAEALSKAQGEIKGAKKDSLNPHFKAKYADLESSWEACREPLSKYGLSVVQMPYSVDGKVGIHTILMHTSGEWIKGSIEVAMSQTTNPQNAGSILTYLRRYSLQGAVGIAPEDDDANAASPKPVAAVPSPAPAAAAKPAVGAKPPPAAHPLVGLDALRQKLQNYAMDAADIGKYPNEGDAVFAWTKWHDKKDNEEKGYRNVASIKMEWKLKAAIIKAESELGVVPEEALPTTEEEQDIPF